MGGVAVCPQWMCSSVAHRAETFVVGVVLMVWSSWKQLAQAARRRHSQVSCSTSRSIAQRSYAMDDKVTAVNFSNLDLASAELAGRGYEHQTMIAEASSFGLPQSRRRLFLVAVLTVANPAITFEDRSVQVTFATLRSLIGCTQRKAVCATELLLHPDDNAVDEELNNRLVSGQRTSCYNAAGTCDAYRDKGQAYGAEAASEELLASLWYRTLTPEQKDVLVYNLHDTALFLDIGQSLTKVRRSRIMSSGHVAFTQTPRQLVMICQGPNKFRLLLGRESLLFQGFPVRWVDAAANETSDRLLQDIAGNMAPVPVMLALAMSIFASVSWVDNAGAGLKPPTCPAEMQEAIGLLAAMQESSESSSRPQPHQQPQEPQASKRSCQPASAVSASTSRMLSLRRKKN